MIATNYFVYIHTSRHGGTFLNKLILEYVPGARLIQYHGHLRDLPAKYSHLPVIGFVRNPWDWYVSMFFDYARKRQYIYQVLSEGGVLDFHETVLRFLQLGDRSAQSRELLNQLVSIAPAVINAQTPGRRAAPGLKSEHFANFPENHGYYSWLFQLMFDSSTEHEIHIGRFEKIREEALRLFEVTGTPISNNISNYLSHAEALNSTSRQKSYVGGYSAKLQHLVEEKEKYLIDRFGYQFSAPDEWSTYPKASFFRHLGTVNISPLVEKVNKTPESVWQNSDGDKPNKLNNLNDTRHIMLRFVDGFDKVFDSHDYPLWEEWKSVLLPIMEQAAKELGYEDYRFPRVMLAKLPAGSEILPHTDRMASHYIHKIHVPLITNAETMFYVGDQVKNLMAGEITEVNNKRNHAVKNDGKRDRVHLIFECYNIDDYGKES